MKAIKISGVLGVLVICAPLQAQTFSIQRGPAAVYSPGGVTTVTPNGANGYTVISPRGVTNVMSYGNGNYTVISPRGVTNVMSNGAGGVTAIGPSGVTTVISNGSSGYTVIEPSGDSAQVLPLGNEGLFLIER